MRSRAIIRDRGLGRVLATLAVLCQMLAMLLPMRGAVAAGAFPGTAVICHAGSETPAHDRTPAHHRGDCALCPLCMVAALPPLAPDPPALPLPAGRQLATVLPMPRTGPVVSVRHLAARPRGPPAPS